MEVTMQDQTVLITGGTGGIGQQTALALAQQGARIVVTGRRRAAGEAAVADLQQRSGNSRIELLLGDLGTRGGVRALGDEIRQRYPRLDVLVNNAGLVTAQRQLTEDGLEAMFGVNVLAPFLLTRWVWESLLAAPAGRVITLTGGSPTTQTLDLDNLQAERRFEGLNTYSHTKLAMMAIMVEYAAREAGTPVTINVCYPGQASTAMTQGVTPAMLPAGVRWAFPLFRWLTRPDGGKSAARAARSTVYLASSAAVAGVSGAYFDTRSRRTSWPAAIQESALRSRLWDQVMRLTTP